MKILVSLTLFILHSMSALGQSVTENDIIGNWIVIGSSFRADLLEMEMDEDQKGKMEAMTRSLMNTEFTFNLDKSFHIKFSDKIPEFMKELESLDNKKWKFDEEKSLISIGDEDNYNLMGIYVKVHSGATLFILDESPFLLIVQMN